MDKIISLKDIKKLYHTDKEEIMALNNISFDVYNGEFISIVGPSGCGKSTILSILSNLIDKSDGTININENIKISYMLQKDSLFPWRTILDNCLLGIELNNNLNVENKQLVISLLKKYGLENFITSYPNSLSGGMRQRVALIRTLAVNPDILLLDEPLSALDYQTRLEIGNDIYEIIKNEKKTVIMVTHDIGEAISMSDRVIVFSKRPASIKNIYNINYEQRKTPMENRNSKEFNNYFNLICRDLNE